MDPPTTLPTSLPSHPSSSSSSAPSSHANVPLAATASSKPSRHVCPDCGRSYKAAETLNRHRKNHSDTTSYVCRVCSASFKRKDLLDRHSQIHIHGSPSARSNRSQRACTRCSRLKTRCDNLKPCTRCARGGHECTYAENRSRARTDRSMTGSPGREESSAGSVVAPDVPLSTHTSVDIPTSVSSVDSIESWEGDKTWADSMWTQSYPWAVNTDLHQQSMPPDATHHVFAPSTNGQDMTNWDPAFPSAVPENVVVGVPMHHAFLENSAAATSPWTHWQRYNPTPPDASTSFDGQFLSRFTLSSHPSTETGSHSVVAESAEQSTASHDDLNHAMRQQFVAEMAQLAVNYTFLFSHPNDRATIWQHVSQRAEAAFNLHGLAPPETHLLQHYLNLYCGREHACWPVRYRPDLNSTTLPPHLFLMMATVGAAYAGERSGTFHLQMMDALRPQILLAAMEKEIPDEQVLPLIESLYIMQACTLYFGDQKAFTFVSQISSIAMALGRRIDLFSDPENIDETRACDVYHSCGSGDSYRSWEAVEVHRRLAIASLRLEVFISLLLGTRPLISYEALNVRSPVPDTIWLGDGIDGELALRTAVRDENSYVFSELVLATLDWNRPMPNIRFDELESVLFGLQSHIWRFSQDPELARRLADELDSGAVDNAILGKDADLPRGELQKLQNDYARITYALKKWKSALSASAPDTLLPQERKSLLASNILYNVSLMRLRADLPGLHRVALACIRDEPPPPKALADTHRWANSKSASSAVESACSIWSLISREVKRPELVRAEFNILAHIGLLHAAVVTWAFAGVRADPSSTGLHLDMSSGPGGEDADGGAGSRPLRARYEQLRLCRANTAWIMQSFATLLNDIQCLHGTGYASYYTTVEALAQRPLPLLPGSIPNV